MKLAVPIFDDNKIYNEVEIKKPKSGVLTRTYEVMEKNGVFSAMVEFLAGCIKTVMSTDSDIVENVNVIRKLVGQMPYVSAETLSIEIMGLLNENDVIEGVYYCPRCNNMLIAEYAIGADTRDRISDLSINYSDEMINEITVNPEEPVKFYNKQTGEVIKTVESFSIRYPTLADCIVAGKGMRKGEEIRVQMKIYIQSIIKVDGELVDKKWSTIWGKALFDELSLQDIAQIGDVLQNVGIDRTVEKKCLECGKVWKAVINTSNFFASGLQPA